MQFFRHPTLLAATLGLAACGGGGSQAPSAQHALAPTAGAATGGSSGSETGGTADIGNAGTTGEASGSGGTTGGSAGMTSGSGGTTGGTGKGGKSGGNRAGASGSAGKPGSGGSGGSGQNGGTGGTLSQAGVPNDPGGAAPQADCNDSPSGTPPTLTEGQWTNISPPGLYRPDATDGSFGCMDIQVAPCSPWTLYLTTDVAGMWKSTDGGASWNEIGNLGVDTDISPGVLAINPKNANAMYYIGGVRGSTMGFYISKDGGNTWAQPAGFLAHANNDADSWTNDVYDVKADPADFNHILLTFHSSWNFGVAAGVIESMDGGNNWVRHLPQSTWAAGHSIWFLKDSKTWLLGTQANGYWRTTDAGSNWTQVSTQVMQHGGTANFYAPDGTLYVGALGQILRSTDNGVTFDLVGPTTEDGYYSVVGDGKQLYTARGNTGNDNGPEDTYYVSNEDDGTNWTALNSQTFRDGPYRMWYEPTNGIIYSSNWRSGVWALKVAKP